VKKKKKRLQAPASGAAPQQPSAAASSPMVTRSQQLQLLLQLQQPSPPSAQAQQASIVAQRQAPLTPSKRGCDVRDEGAAPRLDRLTHVSVEREAGEALSAIRLRSLGTDDLHVWATAVDSAVWRLRQKHTDAAWLVILAQLKAGAAVALAAFGSTAPDSIRAVLKSLSVRMRQGKKSTRVCPYGHVAQALEELIAAG
jgi:hypothetical protein